LPHSPLVVTTKNGVERQYNDVISTIPLPCLRYGVDLSGCNLSVMQTNAIRELTLGPSLKIGVKFKSPWWTIGKDLDDNVIDITGGQSGTDRPLRTIVYPSYGLGEQGPAVLIASYVWTEDAARFGSLIGTRDVNTEQRLKGIILQDLASVHNVSVQTLEDQYLDHFGYDWGRDPLTMGAFAHFGPGEFSHFYDSLTRPAANCRLHFAGEALSIRHGWVIGALNSSWRAVYEILLKSYREKLPLFYTLWGFDQDWARYNPRMFPGAPSDDKPARFPEAPIDLVDDLLIERLDLWAPEVFT